MNEPVTGGYAGGKPPGRQEEKDKQPGKGDGFCLRQVSTDAQSSQTHDQSEHRDKGEGENEEPEHIRWGRRKNLDFAKRMECVRLAGALAYRQTQLSATAPASRSPSTRF